MSRKMNHWKKAEASKNQHLILNTLDKSGGMRFNELHAKVNETSKISMPTLSKHLRDLEEKKDVERYWDKSKGGNCYRIEPESRDRVTAQIRKYEAIQFIEGISNPVYYYHPGRVNVAAFSSVSAKMDRKEWEGKLRSTVDGVTGLFKLAPSLKTDQKMAVVIMIEGRRD